MGFILLVASILALVFGSIWAARAWGAGPCVGLALPGGIVILFVPYGTIVTLVAALVVMSAAQKRLFQRVAEGEVDPDPPAWGFSPGYPQAPQAGPAQPGICPVCQKPAVAWRHDLNRWFCTSCQEPR